MMQISEDDYFHQKKKKTEFSFVSKQETLKVTKASSLAC